MLPHASIGDWQAAVTPNRRWRLVPMPTCICVCARFVCVRTCVRVGGVHVLRACVGACVSSHSVLGAARTLPIVRRCGRLGGAAWKPLAFPGRRRCHRSFIRHEVENGCVKRARRAEPIKALLIWHVARWITSRTIHNRGRRDTIPLGGGPRRSVALPGIMGRGPRGCAPAQCAPDTLRRARHAGLSTPARGWILGKSGRTQAM